MKKVMVIGSNSFSGSDFVDLLLESRDYEVMGVSRSAEKNAIFLPYKKQELSKFEFYQIDMNQEIDELFRLLDAKKPEYIVNFAAQSEVAPSWEYPEQWFQTNAVAIAELCNYLNKQTFLEKYVHISSPEVYGTCEGVVREDAPLNPSTPYAASKAAGDLLLSTYFKNYNFPVSWIRATNVYGPHQQLHKIIPRSMIYIRSNRTISIHGGGAAVKSYIHIRDVSSGELAVMERGNSGEIYHFSPDRGISIRELIGQICEKMGVDFNTVTESVGERLGQDAAYVIDSTKARQTLDWKCEFGIHEGLNQTLSWVEESWDEIQSQSLEYVHMA